MPRIDPTKINTFRKFKVGDRVKIRLRTEDNWVNLTSSTGVIYSSFNDNIFGFDWVVSLDNIPENSWETRINVYEDELEHA